MRRDGALTWTRHVQYSAIVRREGRLLALSVSKLGPGWGVVVVEADAADPGASAKANLEKLLESHAHEALDPQPTLEMALALAGRYARWWRVSRATHFRCDCERIGAA